MMAGLLAMGEAYGKEEIYYCAESDSNGFSYNATSGKYEPLRFFTEKFKMKLDMDSKQIDLAFDDRKESYRCTIPFSDMLELMTCVYNSLNAYSFNFNAKTDRFVYSKGYGYVAGNHDTISIAYGKCDKF